MAYATAERRGPVPARLATTDTKAEVVRRLVEHHHGEPTLVIGQYLDQLDDLGERLGAPVIKGETDGQGARAALRGVPRGRGRPAGGEQGRELLRSTCPRRPSRSRCRGRSGLARRRRSGSVGCCGRRPTGGRRASTRRVPGHDRRRLRPAPAAVPCRAGLRLHASSTPTSSSPTRTSEQGSEPEPGSGVVIVPVGQRQPDR